MTKPNIVQISGKWYVSGDLLVDDANLILSQSVAFIMEREVEIDFSRVSNVDTAALSLIFEWQRRADLSNCKLSLTKLPVNLTSLAKLYGVQDFYTFNSRKLN